MSEPLQEDRRRYVSVLEVATMWGVSTDKVYADIRKGALPACSVEGVLRVQYRDALEYGKPLEPPGATSSAPPGS